MGRHARVVTIGGLLGSLAPSPRAAASPVDVFGLTSRHAAQANAGVASVDDAAAVYYDPAGLVADPRLELAIGSMASHGHLEAGQQLSSKLGFQLAMRAPVPLAGSLADRIVVGLALHLLPHDVARVTSPAPDQAVYPWYGDRLSRVVIVPGIAVRLASGVAIGAAVNVLAGLTGTVSASEGITRALDASVDERIPTVAKVIAGVQWQLDPSWRVGAVYRQRFEIPIATTVTTEVAGEPIDLDLSTAGAFTPDTIVAGGAWSGDGVTVSADLQWARWSAYPGPFVRVDSELPLVGPVPGQLPLIAFRNTYAARAGIEARRDVWTLRGGYGFETSPVPSSQPDGIDLIDGPHHTIAGGAGWQHASLRVDAHLQLQLVGGRGQVVSGGLTLEVWK